MTARQLVRRECGQWHGTYGLIRCPVHDDRRPSCKVSDAPDLSGGIDVICFAGCDWRDIKAALGVDRDRDIAGPPLRQRREPARRMNTRQTLDPAWHRAWHGARAVTVGDPAGRYLVTRRCALPHPNGDLRWHPRVRHWQCGHEGPALIALITDPETAAPRSLHFTWIKDDGSGKADLRDYPERLSLYGHTSVGVVRLWPDAEITIGLAVAEGLETALTAAHAFPATWAALNAGNLAKLPAMLGIEALTIFQDHDRAGLKSAADCAARWRKAGTEVRIVDTEGCDDGT